MRGRQRVAVCTYVNVGPTKRGPLSPVPLVVVVVTAPCSVAGEPGGGGGPGISVLTSHQARHPSFPSSLLINAHVQIWIPIVLRWLPMT